MIETNKALKHGFSVIELMISLGVVMLILSFVAPGLSKLMRKGEKAVTQNALLLVNQAILEYRGDVHGLPEKLEDLDKRPEGVQGWNGSYLPEKMQGQDIVDGWNEALVYKKNARGSEKAYELYSMGDPSKEEDRIDA